MSRPPSNKPTQYNELLEMGVKKRSNQIYRAESMALSAERISDIVAMTTQELAELADSTDKISADDTAEIKRRTLLYMRSCQDSSSLPSFSGLCRSFGYTTEGIRKFMRERPNHETSQWLTMVHDAIADATANAALHNTVNPVVAIFTLKARDGWRDNLTIETVPANSRNGFVYNMTDEEMREWAQKLAEEYDELPD